MYKAIACDDGTLRLEYRDRTVLGDIEVLASVEGRPSERLTLSGIHTDEDGEHTAFECSFTGQEESVTASIRFNCTGDYLLAFVKGTVKNERSFGQQRFFSSRAGLTVRINRIPDVSGVMANYQHKDWWTRPFFGQELSALPPRTQSILWKAGGPYTYLLPICGQVFRTEAAGGGTGIDLTVSPYKGGFDSYDTAAFALSLGSDPYALSASVIERTLLELGYPTLPRRMKRYPEVLDRLGWCSWDAFYQQVNEQGLLDKGEELKSLGLPVGWFMIDDGWLDIRDGRLAAFEADPAKFPNGLSSAAKQLKERYGVKWVGVWHTILGYWGGVDPESGIAGRYRDYLYPTDAGKLIPYPDAAKGFGFWDAWHSFLKGQGIDFVKVDSQSAISNVTRHEMPVGRAASGEHAALEASVGIHFDQCVINCMGMAAENVWNRPISAVSRNSDDFVPNEEKSFKEHALQNVYNAFYHGHFYWGDWDMFWTRHTDDVQSAVLRAISGGPVYFSDRVGETDPAKVWPLIRADGRILRCDGPGMPAEDCLTVSPVDEPVALKIWNTAGGAGILAVFNIFAAGGKVKGGVSPSDVPRLAGERFAVYDHFGRKVSLLGPSDRLSFELDENGCALYVIVPEAGHCTVIGLVNKYISSLGVETVFRAGNKTTVVLTEGGLLAFTASQRPSGVTVDGRKAEMSVSGDLYTVDCGGLQGKCLVEIRHD